MAALTDITPNSSRFSGGYGIYRAATVTAIAERVFRVAAPARDIADPPRSGDMRVLVGTVAENCEDVVTLLDAERHAIPDPDSHAASQACGKRSERAGRAA